MARHGAVGIGLIFIFETACIVLARTLLIVLGLALHRAVRVFLSLLVPIFISVELTRTFGIVLAALPLHRP